MNNFTIKIILYILVTSAFICSQSDNNQYIEIITKDGNIFLGTLIEENEDFYKIITRDGIEIDVPKSSVKEIGYIEVSQYEGEIFRPDPNKSMYLFVPSAYPIEIHPAFNDTPRIMLLCS